MATILRFEALPAATPARPETAAERRVRIASRGLAWFFALLGGLSVLLMATAIGAILFYSGPYLRIGPGGCYIGGGPADSMAFGSLPLPHRLIYVLVALVRYLPAVMLFAYLRRLFGFYARGHVFARGAGLTFSRVGICLCAYALTPFLCHLMLSLTGYEVDKVWMHLESVEAFVLGLLVFVIGQVMQVGCQIQEESEGFV